jgi:hypothetical protein
VAGFALATTSRVVASFAPPHERAGDVDILVDGAPQQRYAHNGRWYVEALKGQEYAIRLHNPYAVRVAVALSVDGLNTIDASHTTADSAPKWALQPYETVTIRGWQTSRTEARRFEFTTEAHSYGQALGRTANLGTISAVFFRERVRAGGDYVGSQMSVPRSSSPARQEAAADTAAEKANTRDNEEYAATGMGRRTDHTVTRVWLDLEDSPAQTVNIRYEFRPQLVRLGILPHESTGDQLRRRERARGFEPGFSPVPHQD